MTLVKAQSERGRGGKGDSGGKARREGSAAGFTCNKAFKVCAVETRQKRAPYVQGK